MYKYRFEHLGLQHLKEQIDAKEFTGEIVFLKFDPRYAPSQCRQITELFAVEDIWGHSWFTSGIDMIDLCKDYEFRKGMIERKGALVIVGFNYPTKVRDPEALRRVCDVIEMRKAHGRTTYLDGQRLEMNDPEIKVWGLKEKMLKLDIPIPQT